MMQERQKRVVDEQSDLAGKIERLDKFVRGAIFRGLPAAERGQLVEQLWHMRFYNDVLVRRIRAFVEHKPKASA